MTMTEKKMNSIVKEIEKLQKSLERYKNILSKKVDKCIKLNCNWTEEEFRCHRDTDMTDAQWSVYFEKSVATGDVEDTERRLQNAETRLSKIAGSFKLEQEAVQKQEEVKQLESSWLQMLKDEAKKTPEQLEAEYQAWVKKFKEDCLKDGIEILTASSVFISGRTSSGKDFTISINNGFTERSFYCYTLTIDGQTIFTSGTFGTAYTVVKSR